MSRERRRRDGRQRRTSNRRNAGGSPAYEPVGAVEFPGIMGWLQRRAKVIVIAGILFLVVSLGAGTLFGQNLGTTTPPDPTPAPTGTPTPTPDPEDDDGIDRVYEEAPSLIIDEDASYEAIIHLENGDQIELELYPDAALEHVNNLVFLALNRFYDGLTFHRVDPDFVAQTGDPQADSTGGPGYILDEESNNLLFEAGVVAMAASQVGISGSQFFITVVPTPWLQDDFTVFGRVVEGFDHVQNLTPREPGVADQPDGDVIERIEILENGSPMEPPADEDADDAEADDADADGAEADGDDAEADGGDADGTADDDPTGLGIEVEQE